MRPHALLLAGLLALGLFAAPASADGASFCQEESVNGGFVRLHFGLGCWSVGAEVCTLHYDLVHPSPPEWRCRTVL